MLAMDELPYFNPDEIPFDPHPGDEGDDSTPDHERGQHDLENLPPLETAGGDHRRFLSLSSAPLTGTAAPPVTFYRTLNANVVGQDVVAVKRALSRAGHMEWGQFTALWGSAASMACKSFQTAKKIPPTGIYGQTTHEALRKTRRKGSTTEWAFDFLGIQIYEAARIAGGKPTSDEIRTRMVQWAFWCNSIKEQIHYSQYRPILPVVRSVEPPTIPNPLDCSGFAIYLYWLANQFYKGIVPSPDVANRYSGYGNTWSLSEGGVRVTTSQAQPMDLAFYGVNLTHVAPVVAVNPVRVMSEGSESGPSFQPVSYRGDLRYIKRYPVTS